MTIAAHVQVCQRHMCSVHRAALRGYPAYMHPEQKIIAAWVQSILERKNWSLSDLAREAKVDATTIGRAKDPDFRSVTSVKTIEAIARAAGERSLLDRLGTADGAEPARQVVAPSADALASLLSAVLPLAGPGRRTAQSMRVVAAALERGLQLLAEQSANGEDLALGLASREAVARFRDLTQQ